MKKFPRCKTIYTFNLDLTSIVNFYFEQESKFIQKRFNNLLNENARLLGTDKNQKKFYNVTTKGKLGYINIFDFFKTDFHESLQEEFNEIKKKEEILDEKKAQLHNYFNELCQYRILTEQVETLLPGYSVSQNEIVHYPFLDSTDEFVDEFTDTLKMLRDQLMINTLL